jgi:hypothetical protein
MLFASSKSFNSSFLTAALLLFVGAALTFLLQPRRPEPVVIPELVDAGEMRP